MWIATTLLLSFILGLLLGFYGWSIHKKLKQLHQDFRERKQAEQVGVVRPEGKPVTSNEPFDMTSETGPVKRPSPGDVEDHRQAERATILRENHR